jgi:putative PIN family toxin of toxin-antitoxin system
MRVVFDTNIFISAALRGGFAEDILALADKKAVSILTSKEILSELRKKLITKFDSSDEQVDLLINRTCISLLRDRYFA